MRKRRPISILLNKFTRNLATGAAALGVLAGVGLASSPAQAGVFTLNGGVLDSEWGAGGPEPIWSTFPLGPVGTTCIHGSPCVDGYDNPLITYDGSGDGYFLIEYFGSGNSTQTNNFLWNGVSLFGATPPTPAGCTNDFANPCRATIVQPVNGALPFAFTTNLPAPNDVTPNGESPVTAAHYFATLNGTLTTTGTNMVYLGFSDGNGGAGSNDDDAADYVIKITSVKTPEPGTILGLLAVGSLGVFMKRKKQG